MKELGKMLNLFLIYSSYYSNITTAEITQNVFCNLNSDHCVESVI